jgi:DNA-binding PadR family transcriptional regulator
MRKISTTAHAMLALLSIRPWSTYDLVQWMKKSNLRAIWPRAESLVYREPKHLEREGLAKSTVSYQGERKRTSYRITRAGRKALRKWLGQPNARFNYRSEALVKVSFADFGTLEDLQGNIEQVLQEAEQDARAMLDFAEERRIIGPALGNRTHVNALVATFILDIMEARIRWAHAAQRVVSKWKTAEGDERSLKQGEESWTRIHERLKALLEETNRSAA